MDPAPEYQLNGWVEAGSTSVVSDEIKDPYPCESGGLSASCSRFHIQPYSVENTFWNRINGCTTVTGAMAIARYRKICEMQVMTPVLADDRAYRVGAAVEAALTERWGHPLLDEAPALAADPDRRATGD